MTERPHPRIPSSTYRLQFNRWFTFAQAREIVPYLYALGVSDAYASPYFDIDWHPLKSDLRDKVLLPILSDQYGRVLERGELQVHFEEGTFYLRHGDRRLPIAPGTYRYVLEIALQNLAEHKDEEFYAE